MLFVWKTGPTCDSRDVCKRISQEHRRVTSFVPILGVRYTFFDSVSLEFVGQFDLDNNYDYKWRNRTSPLFCHNGYQFSFHTECLQSFGRVSVCVCKPFTDLVTNSSSERLRFKYVQSRVPIYTNTHTVRAGLCFFVGRTHGTIVSSEWGTVVSSVVLAPLFTSKTLRGPIQESRIVLFLRSYVFKFL